MEAPVLKLSNVSKKISDFFSLGNITLELSKGKVHVLIGENGSGKSSLMRIIWGTMKRDSGNILIDGMPVVINSPIDAMNAGIAIIHQDSSLFENFTVAENIYIYNKPYSSKTLKLINKKKLFSDCSELFNKLGFSLNPKEFVTNLNIAQKQLVEICKAYVSNARIIIMDEPTASLTDAEASILFSMIRELKTNGTSILYISHKLEEIKEIGDQISVIRNGKIIGASQVKDIDRNNIIHMMTGMDLNERYPKLKVKLGNEVLRVKGLHSKTILKDIDFSLNKREILGITGLVGSGRSKIARCIFGLDRMEAGDVYINNNKVNILSPTDAISLGIGYVTEDRSNDGLFMYMNISENITAPNTSKISNHFLIDKDIEKSLAKTYMDRLGIKGGALNSKASDLSGGNQQKVVLAKWIMSKSKILMLDEPTRGIDIASKVDVYNLMNEMIIKDVSIILISSDIDEVIGMCDRIMVLYNGRIAAIIPKNSATRKKIIFYATGGQ